MELDVRSVNRHGSGVVLEVKLPFHKQCEHPQHHHASLRSSAAANQKLHLKDESRGEPGT